MKNSEPVEYKGIQYPGAYLEMGESIGCIRISVQSLLDELKKDGLDNEDPPEEVTDTDDLIAYYVTDEEFLLPVSEVKKIARIAYDVKEPPSVYTQKSIRELKKGNLFRLRESDTAPVWVRDEYMPALKKFSTHKFDDVNHERPRNGDTKVFTGFTF